MKKREEMKNNKFIYIICIFLILFQPLTASKSECLNIVKYANNKFVNILNSDKFCYLSIDSQGESKDKSTFKNTYEVIIKKGIKIFKTDSFIFYQDSVYMLRIHLKRKLLLLSYNMPNEFNNMLLSGTTLNDSLYNETNLITCDEERFESGDIYKNIVFDYKDGMLKGLKMNCVINLNDTTYKKIRVDYPQGSSIDYVKQSFKKIDYNYSLSKSDAFNLKVMHEDAAEIKKTFPNFEIIDNRKILKN